MEKMRFSQCFCDIPRAKLHELVRRRFVQGIPTMELMKQMKTEKGREDVATVALLDVKKEDLVKNVEVDDPEKLKHLLACHSDAKEMLAKEGFDIRERGSTV